MNNLRENSQREEYVPESRLGAFFRYGLVTLLGAFAVYGGYRAIQDSQTVPLRKSAAVQQANNPSSHSLEQKTEQQLPDGIAKKAADAGAREESEYEYLTTPIPR
jgi:hypothetical protein